MAQVDPGIIDTVNGPGASASAKAILRAALERYGLGELADWAWQQYLQSGANDIASAMVLIQTELRQRPEYKARFPAMAELSAKGHALTETDYINYEQSVTGLMRAAGLPTGFYDRPDDFTRLLTNEVSISELGDRIQKGYVAVATAPVAVRDAFAQFYGPGSDGALAAYFLDPDRATPVLENQVAASQIAGISNQLGFAGLTQGAAENAGAAGIPDYITRQQLQALPSSITRDTIGEALSNSNITTDEAVTQALGLADNSQLNRRVKTRVAQGQGGGGAATTQTGIVGAGTTQR